MLWDVGKGEYGAEHATAMLKDGLSCKNGGFLQNFQIRVSHGPPDRFAKLGKNVTMFLKAFANFLEYEVPLDLRSVGSTGVPNGKVLFRAQKGMLWHALYSSPYNHSTL